LEKGVLSSLGNRLLQESAAAQEFKKRESSLYEKERGALSKGKAAKKSFPLRKGERRDQCLPFSKGEVSAGNP